MNVKRLLWGLWAALILSMLLRQTIDTYMVVALIIIPVLVVLLDLHDEIAILKEENKHQRKFVLERYNMLQEKLNDAFNQIEKRMIADFNEMSKSDKSYNREIQGNGYVPPERRKPRKLKKRNRTNYSQENPFESEKKTEDQRFAEENFGGNSLIQDMDFEQESENIQQPPRHSQDYYDEQVLNLEPTDYEDDLENELGINKEEEEYQSDI